MTTDTGLARIGALDFDDAQRQIIRDSFANGASDTEFALLLEVARARRLNPLMRQIHFVKRWDTGKGREVWSWQVSIDGLRAVAERTGLYAGQDEPEFVDGPDGARRDRGDAVGGALVGDVVDDRVGLAAAGDDALGHGVAGVATGDEGDLGAAGGEVFGERGAEAAARAGDEGGGAAEGEGGVVGHGVRVSFTSRTWRGRGDGARAVTAGWPGANGLAWMTRKEHGSGAT